MGNTGAKFYVLNNIGKLLECYFFPLLFFLLTTELNRAICYYAERERLDQTFLSASSCCHVYSPPLYMLTEREAKQPWAQLIRISLCSALSDSLCQGKMFISSEKGRDSAEVSREVLFVCRQSWNRLAIKRYECVSGKNHLLGDVSRGTLIQRTALERSLRETF